MTHEAKRPFFESQPPPASVLMPGEEQILGTLTYEGLYQPKAPSAAHETIRWFAWYVGEKERTGADLHEDWEKSLVHGVANQEDRDRTRGKFKKVVRAITPDPEVAKDAIRIHQQIEEETRQAALR